MNRHLSTVVWACLALVAFVLLFGPAALGSAIGGGSTMDVSIVTATGTPADVTVVGD